VKLLLWREEVNPHKPDNFGRTPLSYAAGGGNVALVKMLLGGKRSTLTSHIAKAIHPSF